jgi:hypothetical protein
LLWAGADAVWASARQRGGAGLAFLPWIEAFVVI